MMIARHVPRVPEVEDVFYLNWIYLASRWEEYDGLRSYLREMMLCGVSVSGDDDTIFPNWDAENPTKHEVTTQLPNLRKDSALSCEDDIDRR
jgi:hypothetical protein